jgi:hypothetical protein
MIAKQDLGAGRHIFKADLPIAADEMPGDAAHVARGLVREPGEGRAFRFRFDDSAQGSADKKGIVDRARSRRELAQSDTDPGAAVHLLGRLHQPASRPAGRLAVDRRARAVLGMKNVLPRLWEPIRTSAASVLRTKRAQFEEFR